VNGAQNPATHLKHFAAPLVQLGVLASVLFLSFAPLLSTARDVKLPGRLSFQFRCFRAECVKQWGSRV